MGMQASLDKSSFKLKEAQQALQSVQSSSTAQQVQLTQQLTNQSERLATAQQVGMMLPTKSVTSLMALHSPTKSLCANPESKTLSTQNLYQTPRQVLPTTKTHASNTFPQKLSYS